MAFDTAPERTEEATPKRREEAREQGQVAFSAELVGGLVVLAALVGLWAFGRRTGAGLLDLFRSELSRLGRGEFDAARVRVLAVRCYERFLALVGPLFALVVAVAFGVNVAQVGWHLAPARLEPDFERLNPANGLGRLFSAPALGKGLVALLKVMVLAAVAYAVLHGRVGTLTGLGYGRLSGSVAAAWELCLRLAVWLGAALALFGAVDYAWQRRRFEASIRMTKQEVKEEQKREEGDPLIRQRVRRLQRERARQRMMQAVPRATVVVTNPTHVAVALEYKAGAGAAPVVVAKGAGFVAQKIAEIARRHSVPVLERPPLARALYRVVPVGREIPAELFRVVAEVIALVYRLRGPGLVQ
jgi:flagellar biosynthesis protein FlhB